MTGSTESDRLFGSTPIRRLYIKTALPGTLAMLMSSIYDVVDGVLVGQFLGEKSFAAASIGIPFIIINFAFGDLIGVGSSVPISISLGRGERDKANNIFTCSVIMLVVSGAALGGLLYAAAPLLVGLVGATGELARLSASYIRAFAIFSPITTLLFAVDNYLKISGRVKTSLGVNVFMAVSGGVLEFVFLAVLHKDVFWAGIAYSIAMVVSTVVGFWPFFGGNLTLRFVRPKFSLKIIREVFACGFSTFLENVAGRIASILVNWALIRQGGEMAVSAYGIFMYADMFVSPIIYGCLDSLSPAVGYNWGAGKKDRVRAIERICFTVVAAISVVALGLMWLFPEPITRLFMMSASSDFIALSTQAIRLVALINLTRWFVFAVQTLVVSIGKYRIANVIAFTQALVFPTLAVALLWPAGLTGMWLVYPVARACSAVLCGVILWRMRRELQG